MIRARSSRMSSCRSSMRVFMSSMRVFMSSMRAFTAVFQKVDAAVHVIDAEVHADALLDLQARQHQHQGGDADAGADDAPDKRPLIPGRNGAGLARVGRRDRRRVPDRL